MIVKRREFLALSLLVGIGGAAAGCSKPGIDPKAAATATTAAATEDAAHGHAEGHIDYDHQDEWEFVSGKMQSPIDIPTAGVVPMSPDSGALDLNYSVDIAGVENNGHSIQVTDGGEAVINGRNFALTQFHFHAASEHTVDGQGYPMEAHFVNTAQDGRIAVVGVFFAEGAVNNGFQEVLDDLANGTTDPITDLYDMIPENRSYYHYLGSLTTPPLTENVEWYVMKNPVEISPEQLAAFQQLYSHNNRNTQPLNDRVIVEHAE